jgi:hypothetical protein
MGGSPGNRNMKTIAFVSLLLVACCNQPQPQPTPQPVPPPVPVHVADAAPPTPVPVPPVVMADSCDAECLNLNVLKCPEWSSTCVADCARLDMNKARLGEKPSNHVCIANASSCAAAKACR